MAGVVEGDKPTRRDLIKKIALIKDNNAYYLLHPGIRDGEPDTICGAAVIREEP